jgi:thiamine biosynthesis lipoprotein
MGMPVTLIIEDETASTDIFEQAYAYFSSVDETYSPYKSNSEVSRINTGLAESDWSSEMRGIMRLCKDTSTATNGYFDAWHHGKFDPSGLVKGWAINNAAKLLRGLGCRNYYVEAGGDIQVSGLNAAGEPWQIGIRNPFDLQHNVKVVSLTTQGIATSGLYIRGEHIYNPLDPEVPLKEVASLTVIGPNIYEADRFATAAFAMGASGIRFIDTLPGFEAYMIDNAGVATLTRGFERYVKSEG